MEEQVLGEKASLDAFYSLATIKLLVHIISLDII